VAGPVSRRWRVVLLALLAVGIVWAVRPLAIHEGPENWFPQADKLHHVWFFGLLWWLALRAGFAPSWTLVLGLMAYGLGMELAQALTETRAASGLDLVADSVGLATGWGCTRVRSLQVSGAEPEKHSR
jgi:VanZ family protein